MFLKTMFVFISTSQWGSCSFSEPGSWGQFKSKLKSVEIQTWWLQHWLCSTQFWWKSVYFSVFWKFLIEYWPHSLHYILLPLIFIIWSSQPEVTELHMMRSQIHTKLSHFTMILSKPLFRGRNKKKNKATLKGSTRCRLNICELCMLILLSWYVLPYLQVSSSPRGAACLVRA